jgi:hypothetical protein
MSLGELNPRTRRRLRLHGWLLTLWCIGVGLACNALLLRGFDVTVPAVRYAMSGVVMYAVGLVLGVQVWLRHFAASVRDDASLGRDPLGAAPPPPRSEAAKKSFDWGDILGSAADLLSFDEAGLLLLIPALLLLLVGLLFAAGLLPLVLADGLAGLMAEVAVQFVFGTLIARRVMRPRGEDDAFLHILGKTWAIGLLMVAASAGLGLALRLVWPGLVTLGDLLR